MLVVLMYHRISHTHFSKEEEQTSVDRFADHLHHLSKNYHIVLPGDKLIKNRINICLTFDDAYYDFYHHVFPILKTSQIPALLAIPSGLIIEKSSQSPDTRLAVPYEKAMASNQSHETLCDWQEIRQMVDSKLVMPAAHGFSHQGITMENSETEVIYAKKYLEEKTGQPINTFVYPYGRMNSHIHSLVKQHYRYNMRIGSSINRHWDNYHNMIYRINADEFWVTNKPMLGAWHQLILWLRFLSNSLRNK